MFETGWFLGVPLRSTPGSMPLAAPRALDIFNDGLRTGGLLIGLVLD
jgi:hypothetical protein